MDCVMSVLDPISEIKVAGSWQRMLLINTTSPRSNMIKCDQINRSVLVKFLQLLDGFHEEELKLITGLAHLASSI
jgi:hypothetical protein